MRPCSRIYYSNVSYLLNMFRATHRSSSGVQNCNCNLWFYIRLWLPAAAMVQPSRHRSGRQPKTYVKREAAITVFELLMMGGVSPKTCWASKKHWNNKFYYTVASCWFFLWDSVSCTLLRHKAASENNTTTDSHPVPRLRIHGALTLRWLMSYIYGAPILDVSRSHTTTQHSR